MHRDDIITTVLLIAAMVTLYAYFMPQYNAEVEESAAAYEKCVNTEYGMSVGAAREYVGGGQNVECDITKYLNTNHATQEPTAR